MIKILETEIFRAWLDGIKDVSIRIRLARRIEKAQRGNLGDIKQLTQDIYEMREFFGCGWRMYYLQQGKTIILMLGGGNKKTQSEDIKEAKRLANDLRG
jgi:putative addiction module killer protein